MVDASDRRDVQCGEHGSAASPSIMSGFVVAVSRSATHSFSKTNEPAIRLVVGLGVDGEGMVVRKAGVMSIVIAGGEISPGDRIDVALPAEPHMSLGVV
jgi:hypothetical protein